ncbi:MAG TPA: cupin domain-containing protein [Candidatus Tectomicrobia bacterium]|nr:cupin domain-containing protein [Candidatus Tectomicrobia bacterium]
MRAFETKRVGGPPDVIAPDGCEVRVLLELPRGGMACFDLPPGETSRAVTHRTVDEIWFFLSGRGQMWRKQGAREEVAAVEAGVCVTIPLGTQFQVRASGEGPLRAVAVTMPPWPGEDEAIVVPGPWTPTRP